MKKIAILLSGALLMLAACASQANLKSTVDPERESEKPPVEGAGIAGQVLWLEGNQMPTIESGPKSNPAKGVKRTMHVYSLLNRKAVVEDNGFFVKVNAEPVTTFETDEEGNFALQLAPGTYTLLSKEDKGLWANIYDGEGNIYPITVKEGEVTTITFKLNYRAAY